MHFVPLTADHVDEESLGQTMPTGDGGGHLPAGIGQVDHSTCSRDVAILFEAVEHLLHRRGRAAHSLGHSGTDHLGTLVAQRGDGLKVLLERGVVAGLHALDPTGKRPWSFSRPARSPLP